MSQKSNHPTPVSGLNRRRVLTAGAVVAAASAVPALAVAAHASAPSPELLRWRAAVPRYNAANDALTRTYDAHVVKRSDGRFRTYDALLGAVACGLPEARTFYDAWLAEEHPEQRAVEAAHRAAEDELGEACDAIRARPVRSLQDLAELAETVRGEHGPHDLTKNEDDDLEVADLKLVFAAIETMAGKGKAAGYV